MPDSARYDLFFCYSWKDKSAADALVTRLRGERLDGRPLRVFQDDRELHDFDMITPEVNAALAASAVWSPSTRRTCPRAPTAASRSGWRSLPPIPWTARRSG